MSISLCAQHAAPVRRYGAVACFLFLLASCVTQTPVRPIERDEVHELPASRYPAISTDPGAYETTAELMEAIQRKVRRHLVLPPGRFPTSTTVTLRVMLSSEGSIQQLVVSRSSRFRAVDEAVQRAVAKSEPLPVLASNKEARKPLEFQIVFLPFAK
jgi:TonB family protein